MTQVLGVDVSSNNGPIDWAEAYKAGVRVAYVKATQGVTYRSPVYVSQVEGARRAGIAVGAYHFSEPASSSAATQWAYFKAWADTANTNLPPMVDDESEINKPWMLEFLKLAGPLALRYSDGYYLEVTGPLGRQWTSRPGAKGLVAPDFATQISLGSSLAGFSGSVDVDYFNSAILGTDPPAPTPKEGKMLVVFYAKNVHGAVASFAGDGLTTFRWLESAAQQADALAVGAVAGSKPPHVWNAATAPVADPMAFGTPANAATAAQLGLPFP
jgi:hypothetical protein